MHEGPIRTVQVVGGSTATFSPLTQALSSQELVPTYQAPRLHDTCNRWRGNDCLSREGNWVYWTHSGKWLSMCSIRRKVEIQAAHVPGVTGEQEMLYKRSRSTGWRVLWNDTPDLFWRPFTKPYINACNTMASWQDFKIKATVVYPQSSFLVDERHLSQLMVKCSPWICYHADWPRRHYTTVAMKVTPWMSAAPHRIIFYLWIMIVQFEWQIRKIYWYQTTCPCEF